MERLPPGQRWVDKLQVLHHGRVPEIDMRKWTFFIKGLLKGGDERVEFGWDWFLKLPRTRVTADFHCVTGWSVMDIAWEGVPFREVLKAAEPDGRATHVMVWSYGGYSTNIPLEVLLKDAIFASAMNGEGLGPLYGGPLRLILPSLYAWKSAKWAMGMEYMESDRPGFWESRGYHMNGDPWKEERYS